MSETIAEDALAVIPAPEPLPNPEPRFVFGRADGIALVVPGEDTIIVQAETQ